MQEFKPFRPGKPDSRYIAPRKCREISERFLRYKNAELLAQDVNFNENNRYFVIIDGTFIFGDFIEAFIVKYNIHVKKMTISTLSMSQENVESLRNLLVGNYVDELNLIVSDYFFSHEKHMLVKYIYERLDIDNRFQFSAASTHCKICIFQTHNNRKFVFHGSANLRSSSNIEQIMLEESEDLYNFNDKIQDSIIETYKTINKSVRRKALWQAVQENGIITTSSSDQAEQQQADVHLKECKQEKKLEHRSKPKTIDKPERIKIERFKF
jgi:hypothetical protein